MTLTVMVRQRTGRYDAARENPAEVEWPPSPARLVSALLASAGDDRGDDALLQRLVDANPPEIWAAEHASRIDVSGYVVTNRVKSGPGLFDRPGRTNQMRRRVSVVPDSAEFAFVWPDLDLDDADLGALSRLAWDIPYLGRSTSSAEVTVVPEIPPSRKGWVQWTQGANPFDGSVVELPSGDYVAELRRQYDEGAPARALRRSVYYSPDSVESQEDTTNKVPVHRGPYRDLAILRIVDGAGLPGDESLRLAEAFRRTVMRIIADNVPTTVSGKENGTAHVAYVPLPHIGTDRADGHVLGVAVMIPRGMADADKHVLLSALSTQPVHVGDGRWEIKMRYLSAVERRPFGLRLDRWTGGRNGRTEWRTATPMMLDRFPKGAKRIEHRVIESLVTAGYPEPIGVDLYTAPPMIGGVHRMRPVHGSNHHTRPFVHCGVSFAEPVQGPIIAGALRYRGIGLFAPVAPKQETT